MLSIKHFVLNDEAVLCLWRRCDPIKQTTNRILELHCIEGHPLAVHNCEATLAILCNSNTIQPPKGTLYEQNNMLYWIPWGYNRPKRLMPRETEEGGGGGSGVPHHPPPTPVDSLDGNSRLGPRVNPKNNIANRLLKYCLICETLDNLAFHCYREMFPDIPIEEATLYGILRSLAGLHWKPKNFKRKKAIRCVFVQLVKPWLKPAVDIPARTTDFKFRRANSVRVRSPAWLTVNYWIWEQLLPEVFTQCLNILLVLPKLLGSLSMWASEPSFGHGVRQASR